MRLTVPILSLAIAAGLAAPALAVSDTPSQATAAPRAVLICGQDAATRRSFEARYGAAPVFVTAREALDAAAANERWDAPRCMTEREHARYARLRQERAALR